MHLGACSREHRARQRTQVWRLGYRGVCPLRGTDDLAYHVTRPKYNFSLTDLTRAKLLRLVTFLQQLSDFPGYHLPTLLTHLLRFPAWNRLVRRGSLHV